MLKHIQAGSGRIGMKTPNTTLFLTLYFSTTVYQFQNYTKCQEKLALLEQVHMLGVCVCICVMGALKNTHFRFKIINHFSVLTYLNKLCKCI